MRAALALAGLLITGCASLPSPMSTPAPSLLPDDDGCVRWLQALDAEVAHAGVRDAGQAPVPGFPMLRADRLAAASRPAADADASAFDAWVEHLRSLDESARRVEVANLPPSSPLLQSAGARAATLQRVADCSRRLADALRADPRTRATLTQRVQVPDSYSTALRVAGAYALARGPFFAGVSRWQADQVRALQDTASQPFAGVSLVPQPQAVLPSALHQPPPGAPPLDDAAAERLLARHAPRFDVQRRGAFDDIGTPAWGADGRLRVDTAAPVVYQRVAHTLVQGRLLTQLVYTLWFPERPLAGPLDLLGGPLDGLVVRLTLGPDGRVRMLDTIHACGCYHLFFPAPGVSLRPGAPQDEEWAFVPAPLPAAGPGERLVLRIESGTHYVVDLRTAADTDAGTATTNAQGGPPRTPYARRPETDLLRLPLPQGGTRSLYGPDGLVPGTERGERFLFWPMGIASPGAMRQWGHHATAFVGRRHFDDPDLLDRRFTGLLDPAP